MKKKMRISEIAAVLICAVFVWTGCAGNLEEAAGDTAARENGFQESDVEQPDILKSDSPEPEFQDKASGETMPEEPSFLSESAAEVSHFAYDSLTAMEQKWYRDMERVLGNMEESARLSEDGLEAGMDETCIDNIFQCVLNDHPELFFVEGYTYTKYTRGEKLLAIDFSGSYSMDREAARARKEQIEAASDALLMGIGQEVSDYEKVKYVYETIIKNTDYDLSSQDNQNIYSVFVNHFSVCQGYAKATQYLLNRLGVECTLVMGTVDTGEGHAWNLVKVDGSYYYVDTTWGDASYRLENPESSGNSYMPDINYDYLCVTTRELLRTHTLGGVVPMPECVAADANYYVREGALFVSYDKEQMKQLFSGAMEQGRTDVTVKCADGACFQEILAALIDGQEIFDYLTTDNGTVAYAHNEKQLSLTFWVTNE